MTRRMVERHVWQDALDDVIAFTKSEQGRRIYSWRKETIERSFAEAKVNHGLRYARMLGIRNMREQSFLTAAVQNIKRLVASSFSLLLRLIARLPLLETGFVSGLRGRRKNFFRRPLSLDISFVVQFCPFLYILPLKPTINILP